MGSITGNVLWGRRAQYKRIIDPFSKEWLVIPTASRGINISENKIRLPQSI
jgi:hypothetical protein